MMESGLVATVRTLVVLVLVAPLIVMTDPLPATFFPYIVGKALYIHTLIEIATGLWLILAFWYPSHRVPRSLLIPLLGLYVTVVLLSSLLGVSPQRSLWSTYERMQGWIDLAHWFAFTVVLASVFRSFRDWRAVLNFNLTISMIMALLGLAQMSNIRVLGYLEPTNRLDITLGNATFVGAYMLVNIMIALAFLGHSLARPPTTQRGVSRSVERRRRRKRGRSGGRQGAGISSIALWRMFWALVIILDLVILYRSGTRGAVIGLAAGLLSFACGYALWGQIRAVRVGSGALIGTLVALGLLFFGARTAGWLEDIGDTNIMIGRLASIGPDDPSTRGRLNSAVIGLNGFVDRPLLGWGPENYTIAYDKHLTAEVSATSIESFDQAHNKLIEELTTKGALGLGTYMAVWVYIFLVVVWRVRTQVREAQIFTLLMGSAMAGYFVQNLFLFDTPGTAGQFYLMAAFMIYVDAAKPETALDVSATTESQPQAVPSFLVRARFLLTDEAKLIAFIGVGVVVLVGIYFLIVGPARGSTAVIYGLGADPSRAGSWDERIDYFEQSIQAAPGLANYPRRFMLVALDGAWDELTPQEAARGLEVAAREGAAALESEPREWRVHLMLASLYQRASTVDQTYLPKARELIEEAMELGPERVELQQLLVRQFVAEEDLDGAVNTIDDYLEEHSEYLDPKGPVMNIFRSLRGEVERLAAAIEANQGSSQAEESGDE